MPELKTKAIVLRVFDFRETSQIAHLLTPHQGNLTVIARGVYQRRSSRSILCPLEIFTLLEIALHYKSFDSMAILKEASVLKTFPALQQDIQLFAVVSLCGELIDKSVQPETDNPGLFNLLEHLLLSLEHKQDYPLGMGAKYLLKLITQLGYHPDLDKCCYCKKQETLHFFSGEEGSAVCSECARNLSVQIIKIDPGTLNAMRRILSVSLADLQGLRLSTAQSLKIIDISLTMARFHFLSAPLHSWKFFTHTAFPNFFKQKKSNA